MQELWHQKINFQSLKPFDKVLRGGVELSCLHHYQLSQKFITKKLVAD